MARILFVDDDNYALELYERIAQIFQHEALIATSSQQALELADQIKPDIIFVDINMPDMGGYQLLARLKENQLTANIPVVMLSASEEQDQMDAAQAQGAVLFVEKPLRLDVFKQVMAEFTLSKDG